MKRLLVLVAAMLMASTAFGFDFYYDGVFADGSSPFDVANQNVSPISYPYGIGNRPSPGALGSQGGEPFDLEGLQVREKDGYVYVALANSFGHTAYSKDWNAYYGIGDLFIGKDGGAWSYAIDLQKPGTGVLTSTSMYDVSGSNWTGVPNIRGGYGSNPAAYQSIIDQAGAYEKGANALATGGVDVYLGYAANYETDFGDLPHGYAGAGDTYVWELRFDRALLGDFNTLDFHVTLACGNDVGVGSYRTPVPEPATMLLFGLGLLGTGLVRRRVK